MAKSRMEIIRLDAQTHMDPVDLKRIPREITDWEREQFARLICSELTPEQRARVRTPLRAYPRQRSVLAVHWHPEHVPLDLIEDRIKAAFPFADESLIIPTQHNHILSLNGYAGVEVDCYAKGFNRKVQLLLHFRADRLSCGRADALKAMIRHTAKYRASQLFDLLTALIEDSQEDRRQAAAGESGAPEELVEFCRIYARKLRALIEEHWGTANEEMFKNKLVRDFFDRLRRDYGDRFIDRAQVYLRVVKSIVKEHFPLTYFYNAAEVIEETRALGGGVVIPHPEQFWPILLADYDVDGYEVWNPQSQEYTEFLINVAHRQNQARSPDKALFVFMGDDCHMSEKLKDPAVQDPEKAMREIGLQPAWDDMAIQKSLVVAGTSRRQVIADYKARLG